MEDDVFFPFHAKTGIDIKFGENEVIINDSHLTKNIIEIILNSSYEHNNKIDKLPLLTDEESDG